MAVCGGAADVLRKMMLAHMSPYQGLLCMYGLFALPCAALVLLVVGAPRVPKDTIVFWTIFLSIAPLLLYSFYKALQLTEISLVAPILGLTPVTTLFGEYLIFGKTTTFTGFIGVLVAVIGTYVLHISRLKDGLLAPFKALTAECGMRWGLLALALFSIAVPFQKRILHGFSDAEAAAVIGAVALMVAAEAVVHHGTFVPLHVRSGGRKHTTPFPWKLVLGAGTCWVAHVFLLYYGFFATSVSYAMAIRASSVLVAIAIAAWKLNEDPRPQLPGILTIVLGVMIISLWG